MASEAALPRKTREVQNHHFDSTIWNEFRYRADDIIIATWGKSGTTWMQQIVAQLIFKGSIDVHLGKLSPLIEIRLQPAGHKLAAVEEQSHRRFLKTHMPVDALVFSPDAKYIYVGRDGRDVAMSWHHHQTSMMPGWYDVLNNTPGRVGPAFEPASEDFRQYFHDWLDRDGYPFDSFWSHVRSWWEIRQLPNVMLVHFENLKADLPGEIRRIADFLEIEVSEALWPIIIEHCTFDYMKRNADSVVMGRVLKGGAQTFLHRGTSGQWRNVLTREDVLKYEEHAGRNLPADCMHWLETGEMTLPRVHEPVPAEAEVRATA